MWPELEDQEAARLEEARGLGNEIGVEFVAFFAAVERGSGFVFADFAREFGGLVATDVRRVADDEVERRRRLKRIEQVGFQKADAIGDAVALRVALRDRERSGRNIRGNEICGREFFRQRDGDAAGTGSDVGDLQPGAICFLRAASAELANREAIQRNFDNVLGFRPGNKNVGRDLKFQAPEFLLAGEMLCGFACGPARQQRK